MSCGQAEMIRSFKIKTEIWEISINLYNYIVKKMVIIVKPISAIINKGYDFIFFKRNPYLICIVGMEKQVTKSHIAGGKEPKWVDTLLFNARGPDMKVMLCDKTLLGEDNLLGEGYVKLMNIFNNPQRPQIEFVDIKKGDQTVARVQISIQYMPPPHVFDNAQKNHFNNIKNQNVKVDQEQYKRTSNMLSSPLTSLIQGAKNTTNVQVGQKIEQPLSRMAMSTVTNCCSNPFRELSRTNSLSRIQNNFNQYIPPPNYPPINCTAQSVPFNKLIQNESNPLKILEKANLNTINNTCPFPQVLPRQKILGKEQQEPDILDVDENASY